jgi:Tannase-like family of unknown function (DUF6351)
MKRNHWALRAALISAALFAYAAASPASAQVSIKVLSNRADLISGGDALVEVLLPSGLNINPTYAPAFIKATVDGAPVPPGTLALRSGLSSDPVEVLEGRKPNLSSSNLASGAGV